MRNSTIFVTSFIIFICFTYYYKNYPWKSLLTTYNNNSTQSFAIHPKMLKLYKKKLKMQKGILSDGTRIYEFYNLLSPEALCPNLVRVGRLGDGGKWICNPFAILKLNHQCIFYSLGLNNEISFEMELMSVTKNQCKHVGIDIDQQNFFTLQALTHSNIITANLSAVTREYTNERTFNDILSQYNTSHIDILKVDIEGTEHAIVDQLVSVPVCQILIEIHDFNSPKNVSQYPSHEYIYKFLHAVSLKGFYLLHYEINWATMAAAEFSLIHESCFETYGVEIVFGKFLS